MKTIKRLMAVCLILAMTAGLAACKTEKQESGTKEETTFEAVSFTDALDRQVTIKEQPGRVATMIGSFADVWCLSGGKDTLVAAADDTWTQFDLGLSDTVKNLGAVKEPSAETILACEPDFVIASAKTEAAVELLSVFEKSGIPVAYFDISNLEDYLEMLEICTKLTGKPENYEKYGTEVEKQVEACRKEAEGKAAQTVLYLRASGSSCKVKNSKGSVLGEMLKDLGCINIADQEDSLLETLSMETVLAADPDKIFIVMQGSDQEKVQETLEKAVISNPAWQQLSAVKNDRVYYMDQALYNLKPNARWGEAYEGLVDILYGN